MPNSTRITLAICLMAFAAACAPKPQPVVVQPPLSTEPTYTGKYK